MDKLFQIGKFIFRVYCPNEITIPSNFMRFEVYDGIPEYTYTLAICENFPEISGNILARRSDLMVIELPVGEGRFIGIKGVNGYYACYREISENSAEVALFPDRLKGLHIDPVFTSLFALERRMIQKDSLVLHCAYVRYKGKAVLFSAPSETGKTTQANLWEKYRGSRTINGDRALLRKSDKGWITQGWPVCGTSEICHNETTPIHAIVMLSQGKTNTVSRLKPVEAFRYLYGQITVNSWNKEFVASAINLIQELAEQVPVYHLSCTISEEAVDCLANVLYTY